MNRRRPIRIHILVCERQNQGYNLLQLDLLPIDRGLYLAIIIPLWYLAKVEYWVLWKWIVALHRRNTWKREWNWRVCRRLEIILVLCNQLHQIDAGTELIVSLLQKLKYKMNLSIRCDVSATSQNSQLFDWLKKYNTSVNM